MHATYMLILKIEEKNDHLNMIALRVLNYIQIEKHRKTILVYLKSICVGVKFYWYGEVHA